MIDRFRCLTISPINLADAGLAIATARAGGVALLDREFCRDEELSIANSNLASLLTLTGSDAEVGLRLRVDQIASSQTLLSQLQARPHWLIVADWKAKSWLEVKELVSQNALCTLLVEFTDARQLSSLTNDLRIHGLLARGHESGGWVGEDS